MSETPFETDIIDVDGYTFAVGYYYDNDSGAPWEDNDGHGKMRLKKNIPKRPGERPMRADNGDTWFYDWQEACQRARKDGWGHGGIHAAVQADFDYIKGYLDGFWWYCGVEVVMTLRPEYTTALWRVETHKDYPKEVARELAREVINEYLDDIEAGKLKQGVCDEL